MSKLVFIVCKTASRAEKSLNKNEISQK